MKLIIKRTEYNYDRNRPKVKQTIQLNSYTILLRGAPGRIGHKKTQISQYPSAKKASPKRGLVFDSVFGANQFVFEPLAFNSPTS